MLCGFREAVRDVRVVDWSREPGYAGCYSFPAPGSMTSVMPILRRGLANPIGHGGLHFAGEHCSAAFVGYMEGALESGLRVADSIAGRSLAKAA